MRIADCGLRITSKKTNLTPLLLLGVLTAAIWRAEVMLHASTPWTRYFHWAIPGAIVLLSAWAAAASRSISRARRLWLGLLLALTSSLCVALVELALANLYRGGLVMFEKSWGRRLGDLLCIAGMAIIPLYYASAAWLVGLEVTRGKLAASLCLFWAALPVGTILAGLLSGEWTLGRAIRDGYAIPLVVVALGLLFLPSSAWTPDANGGARPRGPSRPESPGRVSPGGPV